MAPGSFENSLRSDLLVEQLIDVVRRGAHVTDQEALEEFQRDNEKVVLEYTNVDLAEILKRQEERARAKLEEIAPKLGADVQLEVASGTPHTEIVRLAEDLKIDLIVMATHGRGFISHAILGSTTERVLRQAPCPVLIVRESGQE